MNIRNSELKVMEVLWETGEVPASQLYRILEERINWKKSTTYTVLDKCIEKRFIERVEPNFICRPIINKEEIQSAKISDLLSDFFSGSKSDFVRAFFKEDNLTEKDVKKLEDIINKLK